MDRLHRPVRRRRTGLRHVRRGRRAEAAHLLSGARTADAALGLRQPGLRLDQRRQVDRLPLACAIRGRSPHDQALHRARRPAGRRQPLPMPEVRRGDYSRRTARRWSTRLSRATSEQRSATAAARRTSSTSSTSRRSTRREITDSPRADRDPMWIGNTIYFNSDRDGTSICMPTTSPGGKTTQVTTQQAVGRPLAERRRDGAHRLRAGRRAADLRHEDRQERARSRSTCPTTGCWKRPSPRLGRRTDRRRRAAARRANACCSAARGDIFTAPIEKGPTRNLTHSSGAHDKWPRWSPDGSRIAFISDQTGEEEVWVIAQDGSRRRRATDHRRQGHALRAGVVGGRQADRVQRQGRQGLRSDAFDGQDADRDRRRAARSDPRLRLVAARQSSWRSA